MARTQLGLTWNFTSLDMDLDGDGDVVAAMRSTTAMRVGVEMKQITSRNSEA
jgi:hypothetical protein